MNEESPDERPTTLSPPGYPSATTSSSAPGVVLTAVGPDRPGLVNQLSSIVTRVGGNIEDTRMARLGGEFAVLVYVTGPGDALAELSEQRSYIENTLGVSCFIKSTSSGQSAPGLAYKFHVSGLDRPGIVESVSQVLAAAEINVVSLASRVVHAPHSGTAMFLLEADLNIPPRTSLATLRRQLTEACDRENLDFSLDPGRG